MINSVQQETRQFNKFYIKNSRVSRIVIDSILASAFLNVPVLNFVVTSVYPALTGQVMAGLYLILSVVLAARYMFYKKFRVINISGFLILIYMSIRYAFTKVPTDEKIQEFVIYFVVPLMLLSGDKIDNKIFIKSSMIFALPAIFVLSLVPRSATGLISIGASYVFLLPIICALAYIIFYRRSLNKVWLLISIINISYLIFVFMYGSRGITVCALVFLLLCFLMRFRKNGGVNFGILSLRGLIIFVLILLIIILFDQLIKLFSSLFSQFGLNVNFIDKMLRLSGDISNGRIYIYKLSLKSIILKPVFGYGLSVFDYYYPSLSYPHNFILQILYDCGLIGFFLIAIPLVAGLNRWRKFCTKNEFFFFTIIFAAAVPHALISGDLWKNPILWYGIFYLIKFTNRNNIITMPAKK